MKYVAFSLLILAAVFLLFRPKNIVKTNTTTPTPIIQTSSNEPYRYFITRVRPESVDLIINTDKSFRTLVTDNKCTAAINGGFYDTKGKPLGLIVIDDKEVNPNHVSSTLNGYFSISSTPRITRDIPQGRIALQSGPLLIKDSQEMSLKNAQRARRSVVAVGDGMYFIMIFARDNSYDGPPLSELPAVISRIAKKENVSITDALNLDGGGASAFYSPDDFKSELERVGSLLCARDK